ncbi:hypothetical protein N7456_002826 [Penicillium angulare]|uniref:Uncharacterized protein n=1 Tax=Penicillium angulare TaxID=116970 RepID=A0A9W9FTG8_9EURO|nr:hypothetical protein N7456_002826 [Penicillium angulare]
MHSIRQALVLLAATAFGSVHAAMGPAFSTGPVSSDSFITESVSTLVLPRAPSDNEGDLSLWIGMGTSDGDLIQSIIDNWQSSSWDVFAYTLKKTGDNSQEVLQGPSSIATPGNRVTIHYKFDESTGNYTQNVLVKGVSVSTLSTSDGEAQGWGTAVECATTDCGTVDAHTWINTKITLSVADPDYIDTLAMGDGVTGNMTTPDGGKTWVVPRIDIPRYTFTN